MLPRDVANEVRSLIQQIEDLDGLPDDIAEPIFSRIERRLDAIERDFAAPVTRSGATYSAPAGRGEYATQLGRFGRSRW